MAGQLREPKVQYVGRLIAAYYRMSSRLATKPFINPGPVNAATQSKAETTSDFSHRGRQLAVPPLGDNIVAAVVRVLTAIAMVPCLVFPFS